MRGDDDGQGSPTRDEGERRGEGREGEERSVKRGSSALQQRGRKRVKTAHLNREGGGNGRELQGVGEERVRAEKG